MHHIKMSVALVKFSGAINSFVEVSLVLVLLSGLTIEGFSQLERS